MSRYRWAAAALAVVATLTLSGPAEADTRTVRDHYDGPVPALNVKSGTFRYGQQAAVIRVRYAALSRKKTVLVIKYFRPDGVTIQVATEFVRGRKRVFVHRDDGSSFRRLPGRHVRARWNFRSDVVRVRLGRPLLRGAVGGFLAWSQPKGAMHGSPGGRDELYVARLRRG